MLEVHKSQEIDNNLSCSLKGRLRCMTFNDSFMAPVVELIGLDLKH